MAMPSPLPSFLVLLEDLCGEESPRVLVAAALGRSSCVRALYRADPGKGPKGSKKPNVAGHMLKERDSMVVLKKANRTITDWPLESHPLDILQERETGMEK